MYTIHLNKQFFTCYNFILLNVLDLKFNLRDKPKILIPLTTG